MMACLQGSRWHLALELLAEMGASLRADLVAFGSALAALELGRAWRLSLGLLQRMAAQQVQASTVCYGSALGACGWRWAVWLLGEMADCRLQPDLVAHTSAGLALAHGAQWRAALDVAAENCVGRSALALACEDSGQHRQVPQLLSPLEPLAVEMLQTARRVAMPALTSAQRRREKLSWEELAASREAPREHRCIWRDELDVREGQLEKITAQLSRTDQALRSAQVALAEERAKHEEMKLQHGEAEALLRESHGAMRALRARVRVRAALPLGRRGCGDLADPEPEDPLLVAKSLQALARRRSQNLGAWRGHLQRAKSALRRADAQCAARVLNACSRAPLPEAAEVAEAYGARLARLLPQSNARQLATAANALARMQIRDEDYIMRLSRELSVKFPKCNTFQASLIANSYARLIVVERTLFGQLLPTYVEKHGAKFRVKDLALVLHAYAKAQLRSTSVFEALSQRCREQAEHMDCQAVSVIAAAHAKLLISDEPLFQVLAWRLRSCARSCTFQAVANLGNAYAKFGFTSALQPPGGTQLPGMGITDGVFDLVLEELPRLEREPNAHSMVLLSHAAARAGQHQRRPELAQQLARGAVELLEDCEPGQLGMLAVAFAELWPKRPGPQRETQDAFWARLADCAARRAEELAPQDAANCGLAFAAAQLAPEALARLGLPRQAEVELAPACACALVTAVAYSGLWAPSLLQAIHTHMTELLWQATDGVACRLALALVLAASPPGPELRRAVELTLQRQAPLVEELDEASLISACQGAAALLAGGQGEGKRFLYEVSGGVLRRAPHHHEPSAAAAAHGARLARRLAEPQPRLGRLLARLAAAPSTPAPRPKPPAPPQPGEGRPELGPRRAGLCALLLPSVGPPCQQEDPAAEAAAAGSEALQRLRRFAGRQTWRLARRAEAEGADLAAWVDVADQEVPLALVLDTAASYMYPAEPTARDDQLHPDAELRGVLLAKEGWL
ncbi:unnamed protein product, partial [Effrenium voratum]